MATGDIASSGLSTSDITNLLGLVSPPGSSIKNVSEQDQTTTKGGTKSTTVIGPNGSTLNVGPSVSTQIVGPSTSSTTIGATHNTHTVEDIVSKAGVDRAIQQILEGSNGLAATASGQHLAGGYNQATQMLLNNDLTARTAGTVALLNKKQVTTDDTSGRTDVTNNSGYTAQTQLSGRQDTTTTTGSTNTISTDPVTDIVKNSPYNINTTQTAQVSGKVAAGIAAGSLVYNAAGQLISKGTGAVVDAITGSSITSGAFGLSDAALVGDFYGASAGTGAAVGAGASAGVGAGVAAGAGEGAAVGAGAAIGEGAAIGGAAEAGGAAVAAGEGAGIWEGLAAAAAWIVCTELLKQGKFNKRYYFAGSKVFNSYSEIGKIGYYLWAIPCVKHLRMYPDSMFSSVLAHVFNWRAEYIAATLGVPKARKLWKGALVSATLYPTCWILGHTCYVLNIKRDYHVIYK